MVLVATAGEWAAALETTSDRARVGRDTRFVDAEWTATGLRARDRSTLPDRDTLHLLQRQLRAQAHAHADAARMDLDALLDGARREIEPPSPEGVVRIERHPVRSPVTFVVELYDPLVDRSRRLRATVALSRWWTRALGAFGPDWSIGLRCGSITRGERTGIASDVICTRPPPWPPPPAPLAVPEPAYAILGVSPDASDDEIEAAYQHHVELNDPARVAHLSEVLKRAAAEQTCKVHQAYGVIRGYRAAA